MTFLVYDPATGEQVGDWLDQEPQPSPTLMAVRVPGSAKLTPPLTMWSAPARGFVDVVLVDGPMMLKLLTPAEIAAMCTTAATVPIVLQWLVLIAGGQPQRVNSPLHISTAAAMRDAGVLTTERHAEFVAGTPPSII